MKDDENREARRRSVWLPATVLFLMLSLVGGAVYWLTLPLTGSGGDQAGPKQAAPKNAGPVKQPANSAPVPAGPVKSAEIKPKDGGPSSEVRHGKVPNPPRESDKKEDKQPPDATKMAARKDRAAPTTPPAEKIATRPCKGQC